MKDWWVRSLLFLIVALLAAHYFFPPNRYHLVDSNKIDLFDSRTGTLYMWDNGKVRMIDPQAKLKEQNKLAKLKEDYSELLFVYTLFTLAGVGALSILFFPLRWIYRRTRKTPSESRVSS